MLCMLLAVVVGDLTPRPPLRTGEGVFKTDAGPSGPLNGPSTGAIVQRRSQIGHPLSGSERGPGGEVKGSKPPPLAAKTVTLDKPGTLADAAAELTRQTGLAFDLSAVDGTAKVAPTLKGVPAWQAVEAVADQAKCFVGVQGNKVKLGKRQDGVGPVPSSVDGPFRVVLRKVVARRDPEATGSEYELHLEVQWEPRFPVYLIDAEPKATAAVGKEKLAADSPSVRSMPTGYTHAAVVRLKNVPREARTIDELTGTFRVVAAARMLQVEFKDLTGDKPVTQTVEGVAVTLHPAVTLDTGVRFAVALEYPEGHPEFESFQLWSGSNVFRLFGKNDATGRTTKEYSGEERGRRIDLDYTFARPPAAAAPDLTGWRVVYETPCPMAEQTVTFTLKGVELP